MPTMFTEATTYSAMFKSSNNVPCPTPSPGKTHLLFSLLRGFGKCFVQVIWYECQCLV